MKRTSSLWLGLIATIFVIGCSDFLEPSGTASGARRFGLVGDPGGTDMGTLGGLSSVANAVNNNGLVAGASLPSTGSSWRAVKWSTPGPVQDLITDVAQSTARGVNDAGVVVGDTGVNYPRAFRMGAGGLQILDNFPGPSTTGQAYAINESGMIAGIGRDSLGDDFPVVWDQSGSITKLGPTGWANDINEDGVVVGAITVPGQPSLAFRWTSGSGLQYLQAPFGGPASALAINNAGQIVGCAKDNLGRSQAIIWQPDGSSTFLGIIGGIQSCAKDVNDLGQVIGSTGSPSQAFFWDSQGGMEAFGSGAVFNAINDGGLIVGASLASGWARATYWQVAPPPQPGIQCDTVARGQNAACRITVAVDSVEQWSFDASIMFLPPFHTDTTLNDTVWSGRVVHSGIVQATVRSNGALMVLQDSLHVTARSWGWNASMWSWKQDSAVVCPPKITRRYVLGSPDSITLGENRRRLSCDLGSLEPAITPDTLSVAAGFDPDSIIGGPNHGLFFVDTVFYRMDRASVMNGSIKSTGAAYAVTHNQDKSACRGPLGLGPSDPVIVSFYTYNLTCRSRSPSAFHQGIWDHEGMGTKNASDSTLANGHEARRRIAAGRGLNDPYKISEGIVWISTSGLRNRLGNEVWPAESRISDYADPSHNFVHSNWCGKIWVWNIGQSRYVDHQFLQTNGMCM